MTTSQSDVDKVMAAFGAAPMTYRPNQDAAAGWNVPAAATPASAPARTDHGAAHTTPSAQAAERILPGAGGRVREIFPLLWRAIPGVGDLKIGAIKRPGDEVSEPREPDSAADNRLPARLPEAGAQPASDEAHPPPHQAAPDGPSPDTAAGVPRVIPFVAGETAAGPAAHQRWVRPVPTAPRGDAAAMEQSPAQWDRQAPMPKQGAPPPPPPPAPVAALAAKPLPPLRSHADLIRPVGQRGPTPAPGPTVEPAVAAPATPAPAVASQPAAPAPNVVQPQAAPPLPPQMPAPANPGAAYPAAAYPPPPAAPQGYPPYYPPQAMPPPGMPPYPIHPGAAGWSQPGYPPPYPPPYPPSAATYPPSYPPAYPAGYPYGYPPPPPPQAGYAQAYPPVPGYPSGPGYPPGYGAPPQPPMLPPQPGTPPEQGMATTPAAEATAPLPPASLSDIFAALHRAPGTDRDKEAPP